MQLPFKPVSLDQKDEYRQYWNATPQHSLDYTLVNLWGWQEYYGLEWVFDNNLCWIRQTGPQHFYWAPLGDWESIDWERLFAECPPPAIFHRVPEQLARIWQEQLGSRVLVKDERGQWEYLYRQEELATLPGNRFHKKKNHYNSYVKTYGEPDYKAVSTDLIEPVLHLQDAWCHWHECEDSPSLTAENLAVRRVLSNWEQFPWLVGGCLYAEGSMIAFSVGEGLDADNLGVHFEKALNGYRGVYQAMNCQFARHAGKGYKFINRAQDLDEEGMRQAKMTYQPVGFLKKYTVEFPQ